MKWLPRWLGNAYSKLYLSFGEETFELSEASKILDCREELARVILSRLKHYYLIHVFSQNRKRNYRLLDPETWVSLNAIDIKNLDGIKQGAYFNLICKILRTLIKKYGKLLTSVILYGSVARGMANSNSDVDLLIVSEGFTGTMAGRIDELVSLENLWIKEEINWLILKGIYADVSYFPLKPEEAILTRPLYLDLVYDAIILYDKDNFFENIINKLKAKLTLLESKRIFIDEKNWYWILKPEIKKGEIVEI